MFFVLKVRIPKRVTGYILFVNEKLHHEDSDVPKVRECGATKKKILHFLSLSSQPTLREVQLQWKAMSWQEKKAT